MKLLGNFMDTAKLSGLKIAWTPIFWHSYGDALLVSVLNSAGPILRAGRSAVFLLVSL